MPVSLDAPARDEARRFFAATGADYDAVVRWGTLGQDAAWKRRVLARLPRGRADVLDYACGTGLLTLAAARRCAPGRVVGVDISADMLARARAKAAGLEGVAFVQADAEAWEPPAQAFDAVLAAYLPKYVEMDRWLPRAARALRPGGLLLAHDFTYPRSPVARRAWEAWWRALGPRLSAKPAWRDVAAELPGLVRGTRWVEAMVGALPRHGFGGVEVHRWCFGAAALVEARTSAP